MSLTGQILSKLNRKTGGVNANVINHQDSRLLLDKHKSLERR